MDRDRRTQSAKTTDRSTSRTTPRNSREHKPIHATTRIWGMKSPNYFNHSGRFGESLNTLLVTKVEETRNHDTLSPWSIYDQRIWFKRYWVKSPYHGLYTSYILMVSVFSCLVYIAQTYVAEKDYLPQYHVFSIMERILATLVGCDWLLNLLLADYIANYLLSVPSLVDIVIVISTWMTYNRSYHPVDYSGGNNEGRTISGQEYVYYIIHLMNVARILRMNRVRELLYLFQDDVQRVTVKMGIIIGIGILFWSGIMQYLEHNQDYPFHVWIYYSVVTMATVRNLSCHLNFVEV